MINFHVWIVFTDTSNVFIWRFSLYGRVWGVIVIRAKIITTSPVETSLASQTYIDVPYYDVNWGLQKKKKDDERKMDDERDERKKKIQTGKEALTAYQKKKRRKIGIPTV